jgi:hypothetical protein
MPVAEKPLLVVSRDVNFPVERAAKPGSQTAALALHGLEERRLCGSSGRMPREQARKNSRAAERISEAGV